MNARLTRNELLRRGAAGSALLAFPSLLAACGGGGGGGSSDGGELKDVLEFSNWELYIDTPSLRKAAGMTANPTTLEQFESKTGIKVNYYEDINGNPEYFATVQGRLAQGDGIGRDIIVSTDNDKYLGEYLDNDWALKLDKSLIPNVSNLIDVQASPPFDPNRDYTLPWFSGMDGIAWNEDVTGPVTTVKQLLEDPDLKGKVGVWGQMGDTLGLIMLSNGDDPAKVTDESFDRALTTLKTAVDSGQIRKFYGNDYAQPLSTGDLAASFAWSGDIVNLQNPKLKWVIPETGGIIWTDNMLIPLGGSVPTASTYMNFVYEPEIAAQLALGANYISAVKGVKEEAAKISPEAVENTLVFPTDDMLAQMHQNDPAMFSNQDYVDQWLKVKGT
jgi:spermidine/putrescine transport system substrate-binding protein